MVDKIYVDLGVESRQELIRKRNRDPEVVMRENDEWRQRQNPQPEQPSPPDRRPEPDVSDPDTGRQRDDE